MEWTNLKMAFPAGTDLDEVADLDPGAVASGVDGEDVLVVIPVPEDEAKDSYADRMVAVAIAAGLPAPSSVELVPFEG